MWGQAGRGRDGEPRRRAAGAGDAGRRRRRRRGAAWLEAFTCDIRYGGASLARDRGFALLVLGILAVGIGANTAMFSLVDAVLLKPLPFPEPGRIVRIWEAPRPGALNATTASNFTEWKRQGTAVFEALSAESRMDLTAMIGDEPSRLSGKLVSSDYFDVFGASALLGRTFVPGEDQPGAAPVIVLSHAAWQGRFARDPDILKRGLILDGERHHIVGVMRPGTFDRDDIGAPGEAPAEFWKPLVFTPEQLSGDAHWLSVVGRLQPGMSLAQAEQRMRAVHARLARAFPEPLRDWSVAVEPFERRLVADTLRQSLQVAFGAVMVVLLIACSNVANLLLARAASRRREMAVRAALGASRARLARQLLTETLVLCVLGTTAGLIVAGYLIGFVMVLFPGAVPPTADVRLDLRVFAFASAMAVGVTLLVGLAPSLRAASGALSAALSQGSRGSSGARAHLRRTVVVAEVALSLVLVCGALLLFRSLLNLQQVDIGVRAENAIVLSTDLLRTRYPTPEAAATFYRTIVERLEAVPGVERASVADLAPLEGAGGENLRVPGNPERLLVRYKRVGTGYFDALRIPLVAGREFTQNDREGSVPVTVISQELAGALAERFGIDDPLGTVVRLPQLGYDGNAEATWADMQVVGVVQGEHVQRNLRLPMEQVAYVPLTQAPRRQVNLIVRTTGDPAGAVRAIRDVVRKTDAGLALSRVRTMAQIKRERGLRSTMEPAVLIGVFACVAAWLAGVGLYGVLAHTVTQQRREIGIRMALGADPREVLSHVLANAGALIAIGVAAGLAAALALTRTMSGLLFGVSPLDPVVLASAAVLMAIIGLIAAALPASRAAHVDPTTVLRSER
jgi:putative ABC transport system permease protein